MKVWVVAPHFDYEGYGPPIGVFTRLELANEAFARTLASEDIKPDDVSIFECELDSASEPLEIDTL